MTDFTSSPSGRHEGDEPSPFEFSRATALGTVGHVMLVVIVIGAAVAAAWWFTRGGKIAAAVPRTAAAVDSGGSPVMLTAESANRIGVTYAVVNRGSLAAEVRTVGLVT